MSHPPKTRIDTASRVILAPPSAIYQAFMDSASLVSWLPPEGMSARIDEFDPREGGAYQLTLTYEADPSYVGKTSDNTDVSRGMFLKLVPDTKIVTAGVFDSEDPAFAGEMTQTWYLEEVPEGTKVTIVSENVPPGIRKEDHDTGMNSSLENLARFTESKG